MTSTWLCVRLLLCVMTAAGAVTSLVSDVLASVKSEPINTLPFSFFFLLHISAFCVSEGCVCDVGLLA